VASVALAATAVVTVRAKAFGVRKRIPRPEAYGREVMDSYATKAHVAPVVFDHWNHRMRYTKDVF